MNNKDIAYAIGSFIEKYYSDVTKVELPEWGFVIKQIFKVGDLEKSLIRVNDNSWTFSANVKIRKTDELKTVTTEQAYNIIGSAIVTFYINNGTTEQVPTVEFVRITQILQQK